MIRAVLFDLDGTLLDTLGDIHKTLNESLVRFSYPTVTLEQTRSFVGDGACELVKRAVPKGQPWEECFEDFRTHYAVCDNSLTVPYEGELVLLKKLAACGVKLAIVTNKPHDAALKAVRDCLNGISFDFVGGDSGAFPCKPDPSLARYAALNMRVAPSECAFVGDGETDVLTAINADMTGVACLWGYRPKEALAAAGATCFAQNYAELEEILFKLI